jgi:phage shock protein PspC (stress-responsive transcriptional regulator)
MTDPSSTQDQSGWRAQGVLRRPWQGRMVAGVAAGVAEYLDVDVVVVRIALVVLTFLGGIGPVAYVAGWLLIPQQGESVSVLEHLLAHVEGSHP